MPIDVHSLTIMFSTTFSGLTKSCVSLVDDQGLDLFSSKGCGDDYQSEAIAATLVRSIHESKKTIGDVDPSCSDLRNVTFETKDKVLHCSEIPHNGIYLIIRTPKQHYTKTREILDSFIETLEAFTAMQEMDGV